MDMTPLPFYRTEFAKRAERREEDQRLFEFNRKKNKERDKDEDARESDADGALIVVMATDAEIADFTVELDAYDTATVEALTINREQMEAVQADLEEMLGEAYVLEDGRRVFKTEDGLRVFDEKGQELSADDLDPGLIDDRKPTWETYSSSISTYDSLAKERTGLLDYQNDLDTVRERLKAGDVSADELRQMDDDLRRSLPDAVKKLLPQDMQDEPAAEAEIVSEPAAFRPGVRLDMPEL